MSDRLDALDPLQRALVQLWVDVIEARIREQLAREEAHTTLDDEEHREHGAVKSQGTE